MHIKHVYKGKNADNCCNFDRDRFFDSKGELYVGLVDEFGSLITCGDVIHRIPEPRPTFEEVLDNCENDSSKEIMANPLSYSNGTHVFLNFGCEWKQIGKYLGE